MPDNHEPADLAVWVATERECRAAAEADTLAGYPLAVEELDNYLLGDVGRPEWRAITIDLCRAGACEVFDPAAVYSGRKPATMLVDGVRYVVGRHTARGAA